MNTLDKIIETLDYDEDVTTQEQYNEITGKIFQLANDSPLARKSNAEILTDLLYRAFEYTRDNNRDLIGDASFPLASAAEELAVEHHYQYLIAYIARNQDMINDNIEEI